MIGIRKKINIGESPTLNPNARRAHKVPAVNATASTFASHGDQTRFDFATGVADFLESREIIPGPPFSSRFLRLRFN
jgi:hypothetical protein